MGTNASSRNQKLEEPGELHLADFLEIEADSDLLEAYDRFANWLAEDPVSHSQTLMAFVHDADKETQNLLPLLAYSAYLLDKTEEALQLGSSALNQGLTSPFVIDLVARCLARSRGNGSALMFLQEMRKEVRESDRLLGRLIGLLVAERHDAEANSLVPLLQGFLSDEFRAGVRETAERMDGFLLMSPEERAVRGKGVLDSYVSESNQKSGWDTYAEEYGASHFECQNDTMYLAKVIKEELTSAVDHGPLDLAINFGTLYGGLEADFARAHENLEVIGYDRSPVAKILNEQTFSLPNLTFLDGDFETALAPMVKGRSAYLYHSRTTILMFHDQVEKLYAACARMGIRRIAVIEGIAYSELTHKLPDFRSSNRRTIPMGGHMMLHDYAHLLEAAGYQVQSSRRVPMLSHPRHVGPGKLYSLVSEIIVAELP